MSPHRPIHISGGMVEVAVQMDVRSLEATPRRNNSEGDEEEKERTERVTRVLAGRRTKRRDLKERGWKTSARAGRRVRVMEAEAGADDG